MFLHFSVLFHCKKKKQQHTQHRKQATALHCSANAIYFRVCMYAYTSFFTLVTHLKCSSGAYVLCLCNICSKFCCSCIINHAYLYKNRISFALPLLFPPSLSLFVSRCTVLRYYACIDIRLLHIIIIFWVVLLSLSPFPFKKGRRGVNFNEA